MIWPLLPYSYNTNVKNLPVLDGVTPSDPLQKKMLATPLDVPVWYERFATLRVREGYTRRHRNSGEQ